MSGKSFPKSRIISTEMMINVIQESNKNDERFCFILGSGASVESGIVSGGELEKRWMAYLMGEAPDEGTLPRDPKVVREYARNLKSDKVIQFDFSKIEKEWKKNKKAYLSSEYYFDLYTLRFYPQYNNGYRYLEKLMESAEPSLGYRILAKLITDKNKNNLVITTNFDSLTEDALFLYTDKKPLVVNHELLANYIADPSINRPIIAKIHRGLFFNPLNSRDDTNKLSKEWQEALSSVFQIFTPIVIGYGGGDHSLMDFLCDESVKMRKIYWCYLSKYGRPNKTIQDLILNKNGLFVEINGFDSFMADIGSKLYSTEITPSETTNILQQRCNSRIEQYSKRWSELHSDSQQVKELKNLELDLEKKREESNKLTYFDYFRRGNDCAKKEQFPEAIEYFSKSIELNDEFVPAYNNRGNSYAKLKQYEEAIEDYTKAIELNPNYSAAYNNRGASYAQLKEYEKAIEDNNKAVELNPNDYDTYNNRGVSYANLKQYEKAIEDYNKAIELNPNCLQAYNNRGNSYSYLKQYDKAIENYTKAIELNPNDSQIYNNRGCSYWGLNQYDKAIENYNKAIELDANDSYAYTNRGNSYSNLKQYDKAIEDYNKAIKLNHNNSEAYCNRSDSYNNLGKYTMAIKDCNIAIELDSADSMAYNNRGDAYAGLEQYDNALEDYNKAIELDSALKEAYIGRSKVYRLLDKPELAELDEAKAKELDKKDEDI